MKRAKKQKGAADYGGGKDLSAKQKEALAQYSTKAKTDQKSRETSGIGKPAGKKHVDDRANIDQMRTLLSQAQRAGNSLHGGAKDNLRLEFSQSTRVEYTAHSKVATGILYNPNASCFTSYNEKGIHVWNPETGKRIFQASFEQGYTQDPSKPKSFSEASRQISCVCYSVKQHLYFACTKNFQLLVFNEYLNCVLEIPLNIRLVQQCIFVDETSQLITCGVQGCFIIQLQIKYTYEVRQAILLNPKGDSISVKLIKAEGIDVYNDYYKFQRIGKWIKGMTLDLKQGYFVCWSDQTTYFYEFKTTNDVHDNISCPVVFEDLVQGMRARIVKAIEEGEYSEEEEDDDAYLKRVQPRQDADCITDVLLYNPMHYFVISTIVGHLLVFKWDYRKQDKQMMHTFKGHSRTVTSMRLIKDSYSSFVSASLDGSVRVWCLDKFIQLYTFQTEQIQGNSLSSKVTDIQLLDDRVFAIMSKGPIKVTIGQISHLAKSYFISQPPITALSKAFTTVANCQGNISNSLITTFDNNSVLLLDPETGVVQSTIYPPPTPTNIQKTLYSMALKRVFVFLQTGTFCVYKVEGRETATLEKLQFPKQLKDYENKSLSQTITALTLCTLRPPRVDSEIFSEAFKYNPQATQSQKVQMAEGQYEELASSSSSEQDDSKSNESVGEDSDGFTFDPEIENFLVMGLSKGSVIFVRVNKLEHIYARFSVHKQQIDHIQEIKEQKCILTMCQENELKIWGFQDGKMAIWRKFNIMRPISGIKVLEDPTMLLFTFPSGESYYFRWSHAKKNLRIMLPYESDVLQKMLAKEEEEQYDEEMKEYGESKIVKQSHFTKPDMLKQLLKRGLLMDGSIEHDEEVTSVDVHYGLKLIASGDQSGLIKIWNFRRTLIREVKFTEPITAVCFLNSRADLVVGHKGKLSRILSKDYLPYQSQYLVPTKDEVKQIFKKNTVEIPEDFFAQLKQQTDETALFNDKLKRKQKVPEEQKHKALMGHLETLFKQTPKFGMPMEQFKALLVKDDRVPKLRDKRQVVNALQAKLAAEQMKNKSSNSDIFQKHVFKQALDEAIREQERVNRVRPTLKSASKGALGHVIPPKFINSGQDFQKTSTQASELGEKKSVYPWRQGIKPNPKPGCTKAIPVNLGPSRPNHPRPGSQKTTAANSSQPSTGGAKTRYQMTQDRIMDNIQFFNKPATESQMNILMVGSQLETQSVFSESRAVSRSRKVYRSKGTMSQIDESKAVSELEGQLQNFMSSSHVNFQQKNGGVINVLSQGYLQKTDNRRESNDNIINNPYQIAGPNNVDFRQMRKNLASAHVQNRRDKMNRGGVISSAITDSMSQPDFSLGGIVGETHSQSGTGTAVDSIRPMSDNRRTQNMKFIKSVRPGTVGANGHKKIRRSDYARFMRQSANQNSSNMPYLIDDFTINENDTTKINVNLNSRNPLHNNTASHEFRNQMCQGQMFNLSSVSSQPQKGFPMRNNIKKNIRVRDMKSNRNATIAHIQRQIHVSKGQIQSQPQSQHQLEQQEALGETQVVQNQGEQLYTQTGENQAASFNNLQNEGVLSQVIDMNENVRELAITPSMRQSQNNNSGNQGKSFDKDAKDSSEMSHTTKGFMGNTPVQLGHQLQGTDMSNQQ